MLKIIVAQANHERVKNKQIASSPSPRQDLPRSPRGSAFLPVFPGQYSRLEAASQNSVPLMDDEHKESQDDKQHPRKKARLV